jgi:hypothetical protein
MFFNTPGKATPLKKAVYLSASVILGLLLSFLMHTWIEIKYLELAAEQGRVVVFYGACALSPLLQGGLWLLGAIGGYFLGRWWWKIVYIDRVWEKRKR